MTLRAMLQEIERQQNRIIGSLARIRGAQLKANEQLTRQEELLGQILAEVKTPEPAGEVTIRVGPVSDIPNL